MITGIRSRMALSHLAVIVLAMGVSGLLLLTLLERYFVDAAEDSLRAQAQIVAAALIPGAATDTGELAQNAASNVVQQQSTSNLFVQTPAGNATSTTLNAMRFSAAAVQIGAQLDTRVRVLDVAGSVLVDSAQGQIRSDVGVDLSTDSLVRQALAGRSGSRRDENKRLSYALPVEAEGKIAGVVYLSQPLDDVAAVLADLKIMWAVSTLVALAFSALAGLGLAGAITRPVRRLTVAAGAVAEGDFSGTVSEQRRDEIGQLGRAFNDMLARLRAARLMQTNFVANVSHELRTPLTSIKGMVETLRAGAVDDLNVRDRFLGTMEAETDRMIRLVGDLLVLSRVDAEALNLQRKRVDLADVVSAAVTQVSIKAASKHIRLESNTSPQHVLMDADRVQQVLVNLLDNAVLYSPEGGQVTVSTENAAGHVQVAISDQGMGIPAVDLPHIGERFYRADKARSRAQGGSGLGVAIARSLVEAHGGQLWYASTEGSGTVAHFTLPIR